tara:strand:- start:185 stop:511 length:327 start_codon:yes stop_codon:yes gene_type:complete
MKSSTKIPNEISKNVSGKNKENDDKIKNNMIEYDNDFYKIYDDVSISVLKEIDAPNGSIIRRIMFFNKNKKTKIWVDSNNIVLIKKGNDYTETDYYFDEDEVEIKKIV